MNESQIELKDLQAAWLRVEGQVKDQSKRYALRSIQSKVQQLYAEPQLNLAVSVLVMLIVGNFGATHWSQIWNQPWGASSAILVYALAIATISQSIRELIALRDLDCAQDLAALAKISNRLETMKLRHVIVMMALGLPTWVVFPILAGQMLFGYNFYQAIPAPFLVANFLVGILLAAGWLSLQKHQPWANVCRSLITGQAFAKLRAELEEITEFTEETYR